MQTEYCQYCGEIKGYWNDEQSMWVEIEKHKTCKKINDFSSISILEKSYKNDTFENSKPQSLKESEYMLDFQVFCENFNFAKEEGIGILMTGLPGTGKTFYSHCIINELQKRKYTVLSFNLSNYLSEIKTEGFDAKEREILEAIKKVDLVVIDDIGNEKMTDWTRPIMFNLFNTIYMNKKSLLCSTNLTGERFKAHFDIQNSDKILDRIVQMCKPYKFDWKSKRAAKGKENFEKIWKA